VITHRLYTLIIGVILLAVALGGGALFLSGTISEWLPSRTAAEDEALQALGMLGALTQRGITFEEYATRLDQVAVQVDRSLRTMAAQGGSQIGQLVERAMGYYVAARWAWEVTRMPQRERSWVTLARQLPGDPEFAMCPAVRLVFTEADKERKHEETFAIDALNIGAFWSCAADQVARADRLAPRGRW